MRISDWSSDVCSSDLAGDAVDLGPLAGHPLAGSLARRARQRRLADRRPACRAVGFDAALKETGIETERAQQADRTEAHLVAVHAVDDGGPAGLESPAPVQGRAVIAPAGGGQDCGVGVVNPRSEEHTSELQSLMRISYAVFCLKNTQNKTVEEH